MPRLPLAAALAALLALSSALAWAGAYDDVYADYEQDGRLTACHWSAQTLDEALRETPNDTDQYNPDFRERVTAERNKVRDGRCGTDDGAAARLRLRGIRPRGSGPRESISLHNAGDARVRRREWSISSQTGRRHTFRRGVLGPGRSVTVRSPRGRQLWRDRGGAAKLWAPGHRLVAQLRYGDFR